MTRVAVVSDSHDKLENLRRFAETARREGIEAVIHAGDIISPFALRELKGLRVYAVYGNNDGEKLLLSKVAAEMGFLISEPPLFLSLGGREIAVVHGASTPSDTVRLAEALAKSGMFHVVVYGHTHQLDVRKVGETLIVNPGTLSGYLAGRATFAVVELETLEVEVSEV
uniref:Phosphoesterase n=1 Tax=Thermofilum pendens TaxID=2269 RepID=A0A7C1PLL3_THEPE